MPDAKFSALRHGDFFSAPPVLSHGRQNAGVPTLPPKKLRLPSFPFGRCVRAPKGFFLQGGKSTELTVVKFVVKPSFFQKFPVGALLHDLSRVHHENGIRGADGGKAVRYDEGSPALRQLIERVADFHFRSRVDGRSRLVENEHGRQTEHDPDRKSVV